jgi:hypothetical protein
VGREGIIFDIHLIHVEISSFNVIVGIDWLSSNHAEMICHDRVIRIPLVNSEVLNVQGGKDGSRINIISCMKTRSYLRKGYDAILAHVVEKNPGEKRIEDVTLVR